MPPTTELVDDLYAAAHELRGSLTELLASTGTDVNRPQDLSRSLGLDKNLARKISRIIQSVEVGDVVQHLPGNSGFNILLAAVERLGVSQECLNRARSAMRSLEGMVQHHVGDKPTLELVLDGLPTNNRDRLLMSRKLSFRGDSGIWGVQARTRINTAIVAPSPDHPEMIKTASIGGWIDFRRLRSDSKWAMFRRRGYGAPVLPNRNDFPIDTRESPDGAMLLRDFCSASMPPMQSVKDPNGDIVHELGPSPVGNTGSFNCFSAWSRNPIGSRYADDANSIGEFGAVVSAPVESFIFDLIIHRELQFAANTTVTVYGSIAAHKDLTTRDILPLDIRPMNLGTFPPVLDTPLVPRYAEIVDTVLKSQNWDRRQFMALRFAVEYPPFPCTIVVSFPLDQRPAPTAPVG